MKTHPTRTQARGRLAALLLALGLTVGNGPHATAESIRDAFSVDREEGFEFAQSPQITREGDQATIRFETRSFCDATVAIEHEDGRILRHLASGVLGDNAPPPFEKGTKKQVVVWDGKDDAGVYVDETERINVRVSLGLKPRFERTLFWHPAKRAGGVTAVAPAPEGVFVFSSGRAVDHLRLFDHDGNYLRTIYPFPAGQLPHIPDLIRHRFPDGVELPIKPNWLQSSLLMSGSNCTRPTYQDGQYRGYRHRGTELTGAAGHDIAVANGHIALVGRRLSRLATDGSSGGLNLHGPTIHSELEQARQWDSRRGIDERRMESVRPKRVALSPDAEWMYLSMFNETHAGSFGQVFWRHTVLRKRFADDSEPAVFAGQEEPGDGDGEFNIPADVACDGEGRVYVADHLNDRIQVFEPDGAHLRNISVRRPSMVDVNPDTGEIYVFSWALPRPGRTSFRGTDPTLDRDEAGNFFRMTQFSALDDVQELGAWDLSYRPPGARRHLLARTRSSNVEIYATVDFWSDPVRIWITAPSPAGARDNHGHGLMLLEQEGDAWTVQRDLLAETAREIRRPNAAAFNRQRLYVNPKDGVLYLAEGQHAYFKEFDTLVRIDPDRGRTSEVAIPLGSEDMAFDQQGHAYMVGNGMIIRYNADDWREVPFDYGEERARHQFSEGRSTEVVSGARFHARVSRNQGGIHVAPDGRIVIGARYPVGTDSTEEAVHRGVSYQPALYPGRRAGLVTMVQILDRHGRLIEEDALPGLHQQIDGTAMDRHGDIYVHSASPRRFNGELHFNDHAGTLMKFTPGEGRLLGDSATPIPMTAPPERPPDLGLPNAWVENAHWMYGGVGWGGHNYSSGCACPGARFSIDYFARSFTPEIDRYNVGVLDSAGNLILRVGQYGNVDEGMPLVAEGGPPDPRSIGGDETALKYAPYVATHSDRRLFVADPGNARVVSVKLGYHTDAIVALKNIPEQ